MLKHPFHRLMCVTPDGRDVDILMMGHCSVDNICAIPDSVVQQARAAGRQLNDEYAVQIFYLGPDEIPPEQRIVLPNGQPAVLYPVRKDRSVIDSTEVIAVYFDLMEKLQYSLQMGEHPEETALHDWMQYGIRCLARNRQPCYVGSCKEYKKAIFELRAMLEEQGMMNLESYSDGGNEKDITLQS